MKMISELYAHQIQSIAEIILDDRVFSEVNANRIGTSNENAFDDEIFLDFRSPTNRYEYKCTSALKWLACAKQQLVNLLLGNPSRAKSGQISNSMNLVLTNTQIDQECN